LAADVEQRTAKKLATLRQRHRLVLAGVCGVFVLSFALEVLPEGRIALRGLEEYPLPHTCASRLLFRQGCLSCGLTRSFIHLASGRWQESLAVHRLGWLLAVSMLLQFPYRIAGLLAANPAPLGKTFPQVCGWTLLVLLVANWCYNLLF
jgi:hypothetical protein